MAQFHVWGRIEQLGPVDHFVIVSAVSDDPTIQPKVLTCSAPSAAGAHAERDRLMVELGHWVRAGGHDVVDVVDD
jgi:hypothetical protein